MAAHDHTVPRQPSWLIGIAWGFVLVPLIQLALVTNSQLAGLVTRPLAYILEGIVLWWAGSCLALVAVTRTRDSGRRMWLLPAGMLLSLSVAQLVLPDEAGGASLAELGLVVGVGLILLLIISALLAAGHGSGGAWMQAGLDTLWVLSAAIIVRACLAPMLRLTMLLADPIIVLEILATLMLLVAVPLVSSAQSLLWRSARLPILLAMLARLAAGVLTLWWDERALVAALPLQTLAWVLIAVGAATGLARLDTPASSVVHPSIAQTGATLLPWGMTGAALIAMSVTARVPGELLVLILTGSVRELAAALRRYLREDDLSSALLRERRRLAEERAAAASQTHAIARIMHDQMAPVNGIWGVECELTRSGHTAGLRLQTNLDLLRVLIEQLRALVRGQTPPVRCVSVDVLRVACDALDAAAERASLADIKTSVSVLAAHQHVLGDPIAVRRILDNLLTNALDATPADGSVRVRLWDDPAHPTMLTVIVDDTGPGLHADQEQELFAPRPMAAHGQRMGLGLSIVRELATAMGGSCGITTLDEQGGHVWIRLPHDDHRRTNHRERGERP